jgi:putative flavoprotein involved in K+ transport
MDPEMEDHMKGMAAPERVEVVVIGGGQAGLSVGYHLARRGVSFVILEANPRVGDQWRRRWDSLRLFTPARFDGLDGMPFPASSWHFPTKDEMADYLETYVARYSLPVLTGMRVDSLRRSGRRFLVSAGGRRFEADSVVVAMANFQRAKVPEFAEQLDREIVQIHSIDYKNPAQLREGPVLIVGAGNSGSEIAMELGRGRRVWMSGRDTGEIPFRIEGRLARLGLARVVLRGVFHRVLTVRTPMGRKVRPKVLHIGGPLIRVKSDDLARLGVERVPRVTGVQSGRPVLADGRTLDVANVIWCTGFHTGFDWIDLPILTDGEPDHRSGVVESLPGLYFVGLHFLHALSSVMIHGVGRDAERIAGLVADRHKGGTVERAEGMTVAAAD